MIDKSAFDIGTVSYVVSKDGVPLLFRKWVGAPNKPTVFIGHTQPTHSGHFLPLANALNKLGWTVCAGDLRAHGGSTGKNVKLAHLDPDDGWDHLISDLECLLEHSFCDVPFDQRIIAANNISGLLTLCLLKSTPRLAKHVVLSVPANQKVTAILSRAISKARLKIKPADAPDDLTLHHLYSFHAARLPDKQHIADVMSADRKLVESIVKDPLGFPTPTVGYFSAIFKGNDETWNWPKTSVIDPETRFLLLHGADDVMSNGGFSKPVSQWLSKAGAKSISTARLEGGRTAILLDEETLGISNVISRWVEDGLEDADMPHSNEVNFETISQAVLERISNGANVDQPLDVDELIALTYEAIDDEDRWVEILYRLATSLAQDKEATAEQIQANLFALMPHWERSYKITKQMMSNAALGIVLQNVIERLDIGTALLDQNQNVLYSNNAFANALQQISTQDNDESVSKKLSKLLDAEFQASLRDNNNEAVISSNGHPIGFYFQPDVIKHTKQDGVGPAGLVVLRSANETNRAHSDARLSMMELAYGLTTQEAVTALEIANGLGPAAIATKLGVSINTIRTHLKRGYEKMGVDGQTEMAARIMGGPIGWLVK